MGSGELVEVEVLERLARRWSTESALSV